MIDDILFMEIGVNGASTPASDKVAGVEGVASIPAWVDCRPQEVEETFLLPGAL